MSYVSAVKELKKSSIAPVYLLFGNDSFLIQDFQKRVIRYTLGEEIDDMNLSIEDLDDTPIQEALLDAETIPFISERKVLVIKNAAIFKAKPDKTKVEHDTKHLEAYLQNPVDHTVIIFVAPYEKIDERKKIVKLLKNSGKVVHCEQPKEKDLSQWVNMICNNLDIHMDHDAMNVLMEEVGTNLFAIKQELEKVSLYAGDEKQITKDMVESIVSQHGETSAFKMVDAVLNQKLEKAITLFKDLMKQNEEPIALLALFASQLRLILQCKLLKRQGYTRQQIASQVKVHPFAVKMAMQRESYFTQQQLYEIMQLLTEADEQMKKGQMEKQLAFEILLYRITELRKRK
ncbi:DNA polymerase III subunit delta [Salirhabdus salicampi]|uniref:DNA polymerase III subunit delta n=1 Tax=Salirhabdus salicampi TaxID=476102 RepID=UPI0020C54061|nr:DNA polymerase III subunit delta [Salirhabdus salicampi]MCP8616923.1 DNA polymerase III subunit delta [Salirhabdus salicampi]